MATNEETQTRRERKRKFGGGSSSTRGRDVVGLRGVLVTSDTGREGRATSEALTVLAEWADRLFPPEGTGTEVPAAAASDGLDTELAALRQRNNASLRFRRVDLSGGDVIKGVSFLESVDPAVDVVRLVSEVVRDMTGAQVKPSRYINRILPIETTCRARIPDIVAAFEPLLQRVLPDSTGEVDPQGRTYAVAFKKRFNSDLDRLEVINAVATLVKRPHTVNLTHPDITLVVEVLKKTAGISAIPGYQEMKKMSIRQDSKEDGSNKRQKVDLTHTTPPH